MRKTRSVLALILAIIAISTTGVYASKAETPMTEYVRNGVTYRIGSATMEKLLPEYNMELNKIAEILYGQKTLIYGFLPDSRIVGLYGFQENYNDGSKAIYINVMCTFEKGRQVFVHELVHYHYDIPGAILYQRDSDGYFKYRNLMEALTDVIAEKEYAKLTTNLYEKAYSSKILEELPKEDLEFLIQLYKGEILLTDEGEIVLNSLEKAIKEENVVKGVETIKQLKKTIVEGKGECISLSFFIFFRTKNVKFAKSKKKCYNIHNYLTKEEKYENYIF